MANDNAVMVTALRVLTAVTDWLEADPADVNQLRKLAPESSDWPIDELACEIVNRQLHNHAFP